MADEAAWKAKLGRPTAYTDEVAEELLERLRNGELLIEICRDEWMPVRSTVYKWMSESTNFFGRIRDAREIGFDAMAENALIESKTVRKGEVRETITDADGTTTKVKLIDNVARSSLYVGTTLTVLGKWSKRYRQGDESNGNDPLADRIAKALERKARKGQK
jgi:hypothetical protein